MYLIDEPGPFSTVEQLEEFLASLESLPDEPEVVAARDRAWALLTLRRQQDDRSPALPREILDRGWLIYAYLVVTIIVCVQAMFGSSLLVGATALLACAICFVGAATFAACYRARRDLNYTSRQLVLGWLLWCCDRRPILGSRRRVRCTRGHKERNGLLGRHGSD
jgi:hypothetical protein